MSVINNIIGIAVFYYKNVFNKLHLFLIFITYPKPFLFANFNVVVLIKM